MIDDVREYLCNLIDAEDERLEKLHSKFYKEDEDDLFCEENDYFNEEKLG